MLCVPWVESLRLKLSGQYYQIQELFISPNLLHCFQAEAVGGELKQMCGHILEEKKTKHKLCLSW